MIMQERLKACFSDEGSNTKHQIGDHRIVRQRAGRLGRCVFQIFGEAMCEYSDGGIDRHLHQ